MIVLEILAGGTSLFGIAACWAAVQRHRIAAQMQKQKLDHDLEVLKTPAEPLPPPSPKKDPTPDQQTLNALLQRRKTLEDNITQLREKATTFSQYQGGKQYETLRADALKSLEDARTELADLVDEIDRLLKSMRGDNEEVKPPPIRLDAPEKPIQPIAGGSVAKRVADPGELHDAELYDEEAGRESSA